LPTGSLVSGKNRYGSRLDISSEGESAPDYSEKTESAASSDDQNVDVESGHVAINMASKGNTEQENCLLDRLVKRTVRRFWASRNVLGLLSLIVAIVAVIMMAALLGTLGKQGHRRCARTVFCICSVVLGLSCGLFTAAIKRSMGEVVILMTFLLCLGILLSSQFDAMMGFKEDRDEVGQGHG
jgi:membrane-associated HD superfamily phosphohydrolase